MPAGTRGSESNPFSGHDMSTCVQKEIVRQSDVLCEEAGTKVTDVDIVLKYRAPHVPQVGTFVGDTDSFTRRGTFTLAHACI